MTQKLTIALSIICVLLAVGLVVAVIAYLPANDQVNSLKSQVTTQNQTITSLNSQITALQAQINNQNNQNSNSNVAALQNEIADLQAQVQSANSVLFFNVSAPLINNQTFAIDPSQNTTIWDQPDTPLLYAGFIRIQVSPADSSTFAQVVYSSYGVNYDDIMMLGTGSASFPVLPGVATIIMGTTANTSTSVTVSAIYYY